MGVENIVKTIKKIHPEFIIIVNNGKFYYTFGKDSYIISFLFGYKLNTYNGICRCGFSNNTLSKVKAILEQKKINYILLDRRNNYDVDEKFDNKNLNKYNDIFEKAKEKINLQRRIENINIFLKSNMEEKNIKEILLCVEKVINDRRKI